MHYALKREEGDEMKEGHDDFVVCKLDEMERRREGERKREKESSRHAHIHTHTHMYIYTHMERYIKGPVVCRSK